MSAFRGYSGRAYINPEGRKTGLQAEGSGGPGRMDGRAEKDRRNEEKALAIGSDCGRIDRTSTGKRKPNRCTKPASSSDLERLREKEGGVSETPLPTNTHPREGVHHGGGAGQPVTPPPFP